jgi:cytochrome c oxidase subunit 4
MDAAGHEDIQKHVRVYLIVFGALAVLTVVTVGASYVTVAFPLAVAIALLIASVKASLVACYFMHLISERRLIYGVLVLTVLFLIVMLLIPTLSEADKLVTDHVS